jgi:hypothetical protein
MQHMSNVYYNQHKPQLNCIAYALSCHDNFNFWRQILMEGPLQMSESGKPLEMFVILFDDMLLISRRKKALSKKVTIQINTFCYIKNPTFFT